jgi:aminoglycoside phosphotransferase (APT) family kinase protein
MRYDPEVEEHQVLAAEWLGVLHTSGAKIAAQLGLPELGPGYYLGCLRSGRERIRRELAHHAPDSGERAVLRCLATQCDLLEEHWSHFEEACAGVPRTLVHADCHADNLRVRSSEAGAVFLVFDWEAAGWAVPAVDLAIPKLHIPTYWSVVQSSWSGVGMRAIRNLSLTGKIFQLLSLLDWESRGLECQWSWKRMKHMRCYHLDMSQAVEALGLP